jgi:hypothetical protein
VRFEVAPELRLFAESVRGALAGWEPPREPELGTWWDEHDPALAERVPKVGWAELWADPSLLGAVVAGGTELGRALAPLSLLDAATLGGALAVGGRVRHLAAHDGRVAAIGTGGVRLQDGVQGLPEPSLDGTGTRRVALAAAEVDVVADGEARLRAWSTATLAYLAGLASASLDVTVAHVTSREQLGAPLSTLPTMQARLADAALAVDGLELVAWESAAPVPGTEALPAAALAWAGQAARVVTATAHQAHGGIGFALESGVHRAYRRAKSVQVWAAAACAAADGGWQGTP